MYQLTTGHLSDRLRADYTVSVKYIMGTHMIVFENGFTYAYCYSCAPLMAPWLGQGYTSRGATRVGIPAIA